jgi:hypothetical protein
MSIIKEVLNVRRYKAGYEVREELRDGSDYGGEDFIKKVAYTPDGHYIGNSVWAYRLCKKRGIAPELRTPNSNVCSIGFCEQEQKWYGWSHRAIWGFGIGDTVKKGDCGYVPANPQELFDELIEWYHDAENLTIVSDGVQARSEIFELIPVDKDNPEGELVSGASAGFTEHVFKTGRGEWTAVTLEDCRQMACDFAEGVS